MYTVENDLGDYSRGVMGIKGRQLEVLVYLLKHKKTTYKQLAQHFEVSGKTIERDINCLSSMGVPVYCTQGVGGGVHIDENYKFGTSFFTDEDIHEIIFALKIVDSFSKNPVKNKVINKLCLVAPELGAMIERDVEEYLSVDLLCEKVDVDSWVYRDIDHCLDTEVQAILNDDTHVSPISYVLRSDGLYMFYFSDSYRMIKCGDIKTLEITDIGFERDFISYEEYKKISR
ncbi:MAG: HTH domain-containing protein [Oscillospiraceae bacterium]